MRYIRVAGIEDCVEPLSARLRAELNDGKNVVWLVSGGSNIMLSVQVMDTISDELTRNLTILLTDERFGEPGHKDSNTFQLESAGFKPKQAVVLPVLHPGLDLAATVRGFSDDYKRASQTADSIIAQFGIGPDGHIAGILPESPAVMSADTVIGYQGPDFMRITLTPQALHSVTAAFAFVFGDTKRNALDTLLHMQVPLSEQPAQILRQIPDAYVYNDQLDGGQVEDA